MTKLRFVAFVAVVAVAAAACGGSTENDPASFGDVSTLCETAPVTVPGITVLGQRVENVSDVEVCVESDVVATGVPSIVNHSDCGDPCFTIEVNNLEVGVDTAVSVTYSRDGAAQDPIVYDLDRGTAGVETGRLCVVGVGGPPDPCSDRITTPSNLSATADADSVTLGWTASTDTSGEEITGYDVWRSLTGDEGTFENVGTATGPSYEDTDVVADQSYYYYVVALAADGDHSEASNQVQATTEQEAVKQENNKKKGKKGKKGGKKG